MTLARTSWPAVWHPIGPPERPRRRRGGIRLLLAAGLALCGLAPALAQTAGLPTLSVRLQLSGGEVVLDRAATTVELGAHAALFENENCRLGPPVLREQLNDYLEPLLRRRGKLLLQLAMAPDDPADPAQAVRRRSVEAALAALAGSDPATAELAGLNSDWLAAQKRVERWLQSAPVRAAGLSPPGAKLHEVYLAALSEPALADGPLRPLTLDSDQLNRDRVLQGQADYLIAPPLQAVATKIRPTANLGQWDALRPGLAEDVLAGFECRLWFRERIVGLVQDYAEMRGLSVQSYRTEEDATQALNRVAAVAMPSDRAGIRPQRPDVADQGGGGRIHFAPDPLLETVYIEAPPRAREAVLRALYLLLPTPDYQALRALLDRPGGPPRETLCRGEALWKPVVAGAGRPSAVRLALRETGGPDFAFSRQYMTRRALAERLQRLATLGLQARIDFAREFPGPALPPGPDGRKPNPMLRVATLIIEPTKDAAPVAAGEAPLPLPACALPAARPRPADAAAAAPTPPLDVAEHADVVQPAALRRAPRHELSAGVEHRAGKPLRWDLGFSRSGLGPDDSFSIRLGQQDQGSGEFAYARDFVGFAALGRRLQLSARVYSQFEPDRALAAARPDERRRGAELRGTLDLWRDVAGSFGQAELALSRSDSALHGLDSADPALPPRTRVTLADLSLVAVKARDGTPDSLRLESVTRFALGRADGAGFRKGGVELLAHGFAGAFTQWELRGRAAALGGAAPAIEYLAFGGEDSVRGYRSERAAGRRLWALQAEWWTPLPWQPRAESLAHTLRRSLALAVIADVGGVGGSLSDFGGRRASLGLGLRFTYADTLTLRLDAARPVGAVPGEDRRTRFVFGVGTRRTLL